MNIKRIISMILAFFLFTASFGGMAFAANSERTDKEKLRDSVYDVSYLLREVFNDEYEKKKDEIKDLIIENNYDYSLTMDSFYNQDNPLKDADLIRYIAAYISVKKYAKENNLSIPRLSDIDFITYDIKEKEENQYIPTLIDEYLQDEYIEDEYIRSINSKYIVSETVMPVYAIQKNGHYKKTNETITITPDLEKITYAEVTLSVISIEDIFNILGVDKELVSDDYERRVALIKEVTSNEAINQVVSINLPSLSMLNGMELSKYMSNLNGVDDVRKILVLTALSLVGKVPYEWGGKASSPGYDLKWWSYNESNGLQHGLDCSGFVQWAYMTSGFSKDVYGKLNSTNEMLGSGFTEISKEELLPGDIGITNRQNGQINHCGIYLGDNMWIHCSSAKQTVTVGEFSFIRFYSPAKDVSSIDTEVIKSYMESISGNTLDPSIINNDNITEYIDRYNSLYYIYNYDDEDVNLLAKLIYSEARGEGINGWIAVGEVVVNRLNSSLYPDTVSGVIFEPGQFSNTYLLKDITPTDEMMAVAKMVLSGNLRVINNPQVLYFKNPMITDSIPSTTPIDWDTHKWYLAINNHAFYLQ